jgi:hypothetical protein
MGEHMAPMLNNVFNMLMTCDLIHHDPFWVIHHWQLVITNLIYQLMYYTCCSRAEKLMDKVFGNSCK